LTREAICSASASFSRRSAKPAKHFHRLGKTFDVTGPGKEHLISLSPDGKYVTTQSSDSGHTAINVWDLHRGDFYFSVLDGAEAIWSADKRRIAIRNYSTSEYEIWDLEKKTKEQTIKLRNDANFQNFSSERILASDLETSFKRLAWLTSSGDLVIRNIETNRQNTIRMPDTIKAERSPAMRKNALDIGSVGWESDGSLTVRSLGQFRWTQTESEVHGILTLIATTTSGNGVSKSTLQFSSAYGTAADLPTLEWFDEKARTSNSNKPTGNGQVKTDTPADTWLQRFDTKLVGRSKRNPVHSLASLGQRLGTPQSSVDRGGVLSVSPDGAYCIEANLPTQQSEQTKHERFVTSLADPTQSMSLGLQPINAATQVIWHAQGKYFMTLETKSMRGGISLDFRLFE